MDSEPLLQLARALAAGTMNTQGRPSQAELKTAVNRAYYALFHTLANTAADAAVGRNARTSMDSAWLQTARALDPRHCQERMSEDMEEKPANPGRQALRRDL